MDFDDLVGGVLNGLGSKLRKVAETKSLDAPWVPEHLRQIYAAKVAEKQARPEAAEAEQEAEEEEQEATQALPPDPERLALSLSIEADPPHTLWLQHDDGDQYSGLFEEVRDGDHVYHHHCSLEATFDGTNLTATYYYEGDPDNQGSELTGTLSATAFHGRIDGKEEVHLTASQHRVAGRVGGRFFGYSLEMNYDPDSGSCTYRGSSQMSAFHATYRNVPPLLVACMAILAREIRAGQGG